MSLEYPNFSGKGSQSIIEIDSFVPAAALVPESWVHGEVHGHAVGAVAADEPVLLPPVPVVPLGPLDGVRAVEGHLIIVSMEVVKFGKKKS